MAGWSPREATDSDSLEPTIAGYFQHLCSRIEQRPRLARTIENGNHDLTHVVGSRHSGAGVRTMNGSSAIMPSRDCQKADHDR